MRNDTRVAFNAYVQALAELNGVPSAAGTKFAVNPSVQQRLETRMQESSDFLNRINIVGVTEQSGEKLGLGIGGPIASRAATCPAGPALLPSAELPMIRRHSPSPRGGGECAAS